jgi:two-component system chemotaxis response regulator CheY
MRILSIDDSRAVHAYLTECLKQTGFQLEHAFGGGEGLRILAADRAFDLILLDWEMPDLTGPEVVAKIIEMKLQIPIIMLTSKNSTDDIVAMLSLGVSEYVMKPFTSDILFEKIESVKGVTVPRNGA